MTDKYITVLLGSYVDEFYRIDSYPEEGDFTHGKRAGIMAGGCPLNVGCAASAFGADVRALDYLNPEDEATAVITETLRRYGVEDSHICYGEDCTDGRVVILNSGDRRTMIVCDPVRPFYTVDEDIRNLLNNSAYIYSLMHMVERSFADTGPLLEAKRHGAKMVFDGTSKYDDPHRSRMLTELADALFINSTDYERLSRSLGRDAKQALLEKGCEFICVTDGSRGAYCYTQSGEWFCRSLHLEEVIDSTGAGDTFAGVFLASLLHGYDYGTCLKLACAAGAYACTKTGGQGGCCTAGELKAFAEEHGMETGI